MDMGMQTHFFWGKSYEILFKGWPGKETGMYILALLVVLAFAFLVEFLSHYEFNKYGWHYVSIGLFQTAKHTIRVGLAYFVMLSIMTFNGGVFIAAIVGHALGYLIFRTWIFRRQIN